MSFVQIYPIAEMADEHLVRHVTKFIPDASFYNQIRWLPGSGTLLEQYSRDVLLDAYERAGISLYYVCGGERDILVPNGQHIIVDNYAPDFYSVVSPFQWNSRFVAAGAWPKPVLEIGNHLQLSIHRFADRKPWGWSDVVIDWNGDWYTVKK